MSTPHQLSLLLTHSSTAETGGYYGRAWAHNNTRMGDPYLLQLFLIIGATPLLSASIYMSLPRLTRALHAEEYSSIRISWLSKIYILIDIACLVLQVLGTVMQAYGSKDQQGEAVHIIAGGLGFQLAAFVVFMLLAFQIHRRLNKDPTFVSSRLTWRPYFWILYATSALVLVRNLVRIVEFVQGGDGNIASHEAFLYVFEAWPMLMVVLGMAIFYPGRMLKNARQMSKVEDEDVVLVSEA